MAEAIVNARLGERWHAYSAGTEPTGYVHPKALAALAEIGINHQGHSKSLDTFRNTSFDLVVTVCDSAAEECPYWPGSGRTVHLGFPDPAKVSGDDEEVMAVFRAVRDQIAEKMTELFGQSVPSNLQPYIPVQ